MVQSLRGGQQAGEERGGRRQDNLRRAGQDIPISYRLQTYKI